MGNVNFFYNDNVKTPGKGADLKDFNTQEAARVRKFHQSFKEYSMTPLQKLDGLAESFGVKSVFVKDESKRFGLNAFKVLGGAYAIGRILAERLGKDISEVSREYLCSPEVRKQLGDLTFVSATDGNHGRGVAWTAQQLGQKCVIYMPKGSADIRANNIRATGATCEVTDVNYDDAVRIANDYAEKNNGIMVQDTAWEGYESIPRWIMQGYMTLAIEAREQLEEQNTTPTHVFLQAGVGSFAGAALGFFAAVYGDKCPITTIVEPKKADCIYKSMVAGDGKPHNVTGDMNTIMAGLACGEPSTISYGVLRDYATASITLDEHLAANGMRILGAPVEGDAQVVSGESGAATMGALDYIMNHKDAEDIRKKLKLDSNSTVLLISTEGDTSPELYKEILWYGKYPDGDK